MLDPIDHRGTDACRERKCVPPPFLATAHRRSNLRSSVGEGQTRFPLSLLARLAEPRMELGHGFREVGK